MIRRLGGAHGQADSETVQTIKPSASEKKKVEVLGDRVRCDVRFTELGLPVSEYRSFFDQCMGSAASSD